MSLLLAWLAGALSVLNPCVLPLLPILVGSAAGAHRFGPLALAGGLALSFTAIGLFVATLGVAIGLDGAVFRAVGAVLLLTFGVILISARLQLSMAAALGPVQALAERRMAAISGDGLAGQAMIGLLLGLVWSPCVGPTVGAAGVLASQEGALIEAGGLMLLFGLGAASPLIAISLLSRSAVLRLRQRMMGAGRAGKMILGGLLCLVGLAVLTGADKALELALLRLLPDWLLDVTTRY